jgi:IclR family pca regulon transcriptional regulator
MAQQGDIPRRSSDFVQSLERGLSVIRVFDADHRDMMLSEVAREAGLTRAAARRFLLTLIKLGYVRQENGRFSLRPRVLELGYAYLSTLEFNEIALPYMEWLVAEVNESCSISVLDGTDIVYVLRVPTRRIMTITISVGTRLPAWVTSMGRVLLADLPEGELDELLARSEIRRMTKRTVAGEAELRKLLAKIRDQGYAMVDQELEEGLRSMALPIHDASGKVIAAMNVSASSSRTGMRALRHDYLPPAREAVAKIEADLVSADIR